jgi:serine/threonine-protein kinase
VNGRAGQECLAARPAAEPGFLRVLAHPWAHVEIDGKQLRTTPVDAPIPLAPGKHIVRLVNPFFEAYETEVEIASKKVTSLTRALRRTTHATDAGP